MVQLAAQYLNHELPPNFKPEKRHQGASKTMEYREAVKNYKDSRKEVRLEDLDLDALELETAQERADTGGMSLEEGEGIPSVGEEMGWAGKMETTGVTHLVHQWYPLGHSVSDLKI